MVTQVKTWGNGQGIRFSKELLAAAGIHVNEFLDVRIENDSIIISKKFRHKTLEERTAEYKGMIGPYDEFSWGEAGGREQW